MQLIYAGESIHRRFDRSPFSSDADEGARGEVDGESAEETRNRLGIAWKLLGREDRDRRSCCSLFCLADKIQITSPGLRNSNRPTAPWYDHFRAVRLFYFYIFQKKNYRNIFLVLDFTVLYPYRPAGGTAGGR